MNDLTKLPETERVKKISCEFRRATDLTAIKSRSLAYQGNVATLRIDAALLFALVFLVFPPLVLFHFEATFWPIMLSSLAGLTIIAVLDFKSAAERLEGDGQKIQWTSLLPLLAPPLATIRSETELAKGLLERFEQIAIARALCDEEDLRQTASAIIRKLKYAKRLANSAAENEHEDYFYETSWVEASNCIQDLIDPAQLLAPPDRDTQSLSYCPRCYCQYLMPRERCVDCEIDLCLFGSPQH